MSRDSWRLYRIPQPLQKDTGLNITVVGALNTSDADLFISEVLPRSVYDFTRIGGRDGANVRGLPPCCVPQARHPVTLARSPQESLLVVNRSLSGRFWLGVYAKTDGEFSIRAQRQELPTDKDDPSFLEEVRRPALCRTLLARRAPPHPLASLAPSCLSGRRRLLRETRLPLARASWSSSSALAAAGSSARPRTRSRSPRTRCGQRCRTLDRCGTSPSSRARGRSTGRSRRPAPLGCSKPRPPATLKCGRRTGGSSTTIRCPAPGTCPTSAPAGEQRLRSRLRRRPTATRDNMASKRPGNTRRKGTRPALLLRRLPPAARQPGRRAAYHQAWTRASWLQ